MATASPGRTATPLTAARLAIQLCHDAYAFRGPAEASGWVERAALLVEGQPPSVATAWVTLLRAHFALADHHPDVALAGSARAIALAREVEAVDVEMLALALNGLALVSTGEIEDGMRRLDAAAAAAVGGEMTDADSIETVCCHMIDACKLVRDLERATEWCLRVRDIATRFADRQMFSICRTAYADVLLWHGDWERAEEELLAAIEELGVLRPGRDVDPLARLAELRRRQGRTGEAEELLARVESHRFHALLVGLLALDRGDAETAIDAAARFLRRVGEADRFERVAGLDLMVRAAVAGGDDASAREAADEIAVIAAACPNAPLRAAALLAEGRVAAAAGEAAAACPLLEDASDFFDAAGARYDAALARLELASVLRVLGARRAGGEGRGARRQGAGRSSARGHRRRASAGSRRARPRCSDWSHADSRTARSPASSCSACAPWSATWPTSTSRSVPPAARRARSRPPGPTRTELRSERPHVGYRHRCDAGRAAPSFGFEPGAGTPPATGAATCRRRRERPHQRRSRWKGSRYSSSTSTAATRSASSRTPRMPTSRSSSAGCRTTAASCLAGAT